MSRTLSPEEVEQLRLTLRTHYSTNLIDQLAELALDGIRFRTWIRLAYAKPGAVAIALGPCLNPNEYRTAIDSLIVAEIRGG